MPARIEQKPVLAIALNRVAGDVALRRALHAGVEVVVLAERGASTEGAAQVIEVGMNEARVGSAVREAVRRDLAWVAVPRSIGTADYLLSAALRSVGRHVDAAHPGVAMMVVSTHASPERDYRRLLGVIDPAGPRTSGVAALASVELAARTGAALDVVVLGHDGGTSPASTEDWLALLPVERRTDLLRRAHLRSRELGVEVAWLPTAQTDPVAAVAEQSSKADYDVVVDSLGGHRLRKRVGKNHDIRRLLADRAHSGVLRAGLDRTDADVLVVVDGVSLGMVPAPVVRASATAAGAAAAVAVGTVTAAAPAAAVGPTVAPAVVGSALTDAGGEISKAEVDDAAQQAAAAVKAAEEAQRAAATTEREISTAAERAEQAAEQLDAAVKHAEPTALDLERALEDSAVADAEVRNAKQEQARLAKAAHTYSPTAADVLAQERADEAAETLEAAQEEAAEAVSAAAQAYEEYKVFEQDVLAAEEAFATADEQARAARATFERQAAEAEAATAEAEKREKAAAEIREAWKDQGLHAPATGGVTSPFGPRVHPVTGVYKLHTGTDFEGQDGNYYAMADGTVTYAAYDGAYGYMVKVDHGTLAGHQVESWYAHQPGVSVSVGQKVAKGEVIGRIGNSGYSTGPHAHVELHLDGQPVDLADHLH